MSEHAVRDLLLLSRRGLRAPGAQELKEELEALGASVTIAACDASDAGQLEGVVDGIGAERRLAAVIHAAGVLDDALAGSTSVEQIDRVLAPKLDAALNLDRLTRELRPSAFVLFSSVAATLGSPGQAAYAAANACLDALAARRCAQGLPGLSIGWGLWESAGMAAGLAEADLARLRRGGLAPLSPRSALELFDLALRTGRAQVLAAHVDRGALREQARAGSIAPLLRGLVRMPSAVAGPERERWFVRRVLDAPAPARERVATELVCAEIAEVLGHSGGQAVDAQLPLGDLGFDSLTAVELRNRLSAMAGLQLAPTVVFDHPTAAALAAHLLEWVSREHERGTRDGTGEPVAGEAAQAQLDRLEHALLAIDAGPRRAALAARLQGIAGRLLTDSPDSEQASVAPDIESASDEEIFGFIDRELGLAEDRG